MKKPVVAFVCVHNSCRSQMAEALGKLVGKDTFDSYSGGTETKDQINQEAVGVVKELYGIDMELHQRSKLIDELPAIDILITMGCNVNCPHLPARHREDWGLEDPSGKEKEEFVKTAQLVEEKIRDLKKRIEAGEI